jgi:hypothetical protein
VSDDVKAPGGTEPDGQSTTASISGLIRLPGSTSTAATTTLPAAMPRLSAAHPTANSAAPMPAITASTISATAFMFFMADLL